MIIHNQRHVCVLYLYVCGAGCYWPMQWVMPACCLLVNGFDIIILDRISCVCLNKWPKDPSAPQRQVTLQDKQWTPSFLRHQLKHFFKKQ